VDRRGRALASPAAGVLVYGGSAAGVMAAVETARQGRRAVLVAPEQHLGGMAVEGLGGAGINNHWFQNGTALGGLAREFYLRLGRKYGQQGPAYLYEPRVASIRTAATPRANGFIAST
jgi:hypothetical protein